MMSLPISTSWSSSVPQITLYISLQQMPTYDLYYNDVISDSSIHHSVYYPNITKLILRYHD